MNSLILLIAKRFIKIILNRYLILMLIPAISLAWEVDMSRRQNDLNKYEYDHNARLPAALMKNEPQALPSKTLLERAVTVAEPEQEVVILNTENGFVPATVRLKKNGSYKIVVVNVNEKEKNTSFIMDAFSEHHATYFGKVKSFTISPKIEGVFSFQSPETAAQGKIIVYSEAKSTLKAEL